MRSSTRIKDLAKMNRKNETQAESIFWEAIRRKGLEGFKFYRQRPIWRYIVDFYCPRLKMVVEIDGAIHEQPEQKENDQFRDNILKGKGLTVVRFSNEQVLHDLARCLETIKRYLPISRENN